MFTIRVVIDGAEQADWQAAGLRLRSAAIDTCVEVGRSQERLDSCQAVIFAGKQSAYKGLVERLLEAGKHVLVTAESGLSSDECETMSAAARRSGVQLAIANCDCYLPSRQLVRQQVADKLGGEALVRIHRWEPAMADSQTDLFGLPGPLVRNLHLVLWLTGKRPERVYAVERLAREDGVSAGQFIQVHLGFAEGMALVDYNNRLPSGDSYQSLSVIGLAGAAYADDHHNVQLVYGGGHPQAIRTGEGMRQRVAVLQEFADALAAGRDLSASVTLWRGALAVAEAVRTSIASRQAVPLEGC